MRFRGKELRAAGLEPGPAMGIAQRELVPAARRLGRDGALARLAEVVRDPQANAGDPDFAGVVRQLLADVRKLSERFVERAEPAPYASWYEEGDEAAIAQMEHAMRLPSAVRGA